MLSQLTIFSSWKCSSNEIVGVDEKVELFEAIQTVIEEIK